MPKHPSMGADRMATFGARDQAMWLFQRAAELADYLVDYFGNILHEAVLIG